MALSATLSDLSRSVFQPLIRLDRDASPHASLTARAATHWLSCDAFDAFGASMGLIGSTRDLLKRGGLDLEVDSATQLSGDHPIVDELRAALAGDGIEPERSLYLARLLIILAFGTEAQKLIRSIEPSNARVALGSIWLNSLAESLIAPDTWSWTPLAEAAATSRLEGKLGFHVALLLGTTHIQRGDLTEAQRYLDLAQATIQWSGPERTLAEARVTRHRASLALALGDERKHDRALEEALRAIKSSQKNYLFLELERRVREYRSWRALGTGREKEVRSDVLRLQKIDPTCARVWLLSAEHAIATGDRHAAVDALQRVITYGVLERPYALFLASRLATHPMLARTMLVDFVQRDHFHAPETLDAALRRAIDLPELEAPATASLADWLRELGAKNSSAVPPRPITIEAIERLEASAAKATPRSVLEKSEIFSRFTSFWTLDEPRSRTCLAAYTPVLAWWAFEQDPPPNYQTLYLQRVTQIEFREELFRAAFSVNTDLERRLPEAYSIEALRGWSPRTDKLLELMSNPPKSALQRVRLCRVLAGLGFVKHAREVLEPMPDPGQPWTIDETYLAITNYLYGRVLDLEYGTRRAADLELFYSKLPDTDDALRFRVLICLHGTVFQGQENKVEDTERWRNEGLKVLARIDKCGAFEDFERSLLTSRFYRAASYHPYVTGNKAMLREDARLCEEHARAMRPSSRLQQLVCDENTFPMLESVARIYASLGEYDRALACIQEVAHSLDPLDARAWLQLGDAYEKRGDADAALDAFLRAASIGAPFGKVAWYMAGTCFEERDELLEARHCYLQSLHHEPRGASPLDGLERIARQTNDSHLATWVAEARADAQRMPRIQ